MIRTYINALSEAKKPDIQGKHTTPAWLGRVPKEDVPAVLRYLKSTGKAARAVYRDRRFPKVDRNRSVWGGSVRKDQGTHADLYRVTRTKAKYAKPYKRVGNRPFTKEEYFLYVDQETGESLVPVGKKLFFELPYSEQRRIMLTTPD
jgi:hypothetical protein